MLTSQFIGLNLYFSVNIFAALVAFAVFWLIFDAWLERRSRLELLKWAGFLIVSIGFLVRAAAVQSNSGSWSAAMAVATELLRLLGYAAIALGQLLEPLQERPHVSLDLPELAGLAPTATAPLSSTSPKRPRKATKSHKSIFVTGVAGLANFAVPFLAATIAVLYWRRATTGLERHLSPVAYGFATLTVFELLNIATNFTGTANPNLYQLVAMYGPLWWAAVIVLAFAASILGHWVWQYLVKRLQSQLFIMLVGQTLVVFLVSTVGFTFLLLHNAQDQALADLATASHVLGYAVTNLQAETAAQAEVVAGNPAVSTALAVHDRTTLSATLANYLPQHNLTNLTVTDASAQILLRGADPSRWGDSLSSDPLIRRALVGETSNSVTIAGGVVAPTVTLAAARPIRDATGAIIGTVTTSRDITGSFVDGIRSATGLEASVYGNNVLAATTLTAADGSRAVGVTETATAITNQVLTHGHSFAGAVSFQNRAYLAAYTPLKDVNNTVVGMLLVARPADTLLAAANRSIQFIFIFVIALIIVAVYPIYRVAKYLSQEIK